MYQLFYHDSCSREFFGQLSEQQALALTQTCKIALSAMDPFLDGLTFACTRPKVLTNGPPPTLKAWKLLWQSCAQSVRDACLDPALLVHAAAAWRKREPETESQNRKAAWDLCRLGDRDPFLCDFMKMSQDPAENGITVVPESSVENHLRSHAYISAVLAIECFERVTKDHRRDRNTYTSVVALVNTSDGQIALLKFWMQDVCGFGQSRRAYRQNAMLFLGSDPTHVFNIARDVLPRRAKWSTIERVGTKVLRIGLNLDICERNSSWVQGQPGFPKPVLLEAKQYANKDRAATILKKESLLLDEGGWTSFFRGIVSSLPCGKW